MHHNNTCKVLFFQNSLILHTFFAQVNPHNDCLFKENVGEIESWTHWEVRFIVSPDPELNLTLQHLRPLPSLQL